MDSEEALVQLLFESVAQQPIISNQAQEFWLGVQLQAVSRWQWIKSQDDESPINVLASHMLQTPSVPDAIDCTPPISRWCEELLQAQRNIYKLKRSRIRRAYVQIKQAKQSETIKQIELMCELLCLLPNSILQQMQVYERQWGMLPDEITLTRWLEKESDWEALRILAETRTHIAQKHLINGYLRYGLRMARQQVGQGVPYLDLAQAAFEGLIHAATKFDYRESVRFGSYAVTWAWQRTNRYIAETNRTIRIPVHRVETIRKLHKICEEYACTVEDPIALVAVGLLAEQEQAKINKASRNGRSLSKKLAEKYADAKKKARQLMSDSLPIVSLDALDPNQLYDDAPDVTALVDRSLRQSIVEEQLLMLLPIRQQHIMKERFGLCGRGEEKTLAQIGEKLGLSRERIRQVEKKALTTLGNRAKALPNTLSYCEAAVLRARYGLLKDSLPQTVEEVAEKLELSPDKVKEIEQRAVDKWRRDENHVGLPTLYDLLSDDPPHVSLLRASNEADWQDEEDWTWLDALLDGLPRSEWGRWKRGLGRQEQLTNALTSYDAPAHYRDIAEAMNAEVEGSELDEARIYGLLNKYPETFINLGEGVFSFVAWEKGRLDQLNPVLPYCPQLLPDPPDYEDAFLESVLVGRNHLTSQPTTSDFLNQMLRWSQVDPPPATWHQQSLLNAYYIVGLIPYTFHYDGSNSNLHCTLADLSVSALRDYCLACVTERLLAMPQFWWLLRNMQPIRSTAFGDTFSDVHPHGLDDVLQRLYLLTALGATIKARHGDYRLTSLGERCANRWQRMPNWEEEDSAETHTNHFFDFDIW